MTLFSKRYSVPSDEDYEPGSENEVLKNFLSIKNKRDIEIVEEQELERTELELLDIFTKDHQFVAADICNIHELWLGDVYPSAGRYRTVNMSKDGFLFTAPAHIERLMQLFEENFLVKYTPCDNLQLDELINALSIVHIELILIHPFREGNGRTARLLADLMTMQAGLPPLDYSYIDQTKNVSGFESYIQSIHAGLCNNYDPIKFIFRKLLEG